MSKSRIALLIAFGPEVRAFIHSGLFELLGDRFEVHIFTPNLASAAFASLPPHQVHQLPDTQEPRALQRLRYWTRRARERWLMRQHGRQRWRHYLSQDGDQAPSHSQRNILARLASYRWSSRLLVVAEQLFASRAGTNPVWEQLFTDLEISGLVTSSYANERVLTALQTAKNLGIKTFIVTNSWKDSYVNPHVPVIPDLLVVGMADTVSDVILANPHLRSTTVHAESSLHLQHFLNHECVVDWHRFHSRMSLDPHRPYICYTAASPRAVKNEEKVVEFLLENIQHGYVEARPQILLRLNPMEDGSRFATLASEYSDDLVLQHPIWEWSQSDDWCAALAEDVELWVATVFYSAINVSIASTVTLEFAALGRPVVNVCFDLPTDQPYRSSNRRFWEADFYSNVRQSGYPTAAFTPSDLLTLISKYLRSNSRYPTPSGLFATRNPAQNLTQLIAEAVYQ